MDFCICKSDLCGCVKANGKEGEILAYGLLAIGVVATTVWLINRN